MTPQPVEYVPPPLPSPFNRVDHSRTNATTLDSEITATERSDKPPLLLAQGAEAHLYKTYFLTPSIPAALKIRPAKHYRHPTLDRRLTRQRILKEARCLYRLVREGVRVPAVYALDWEGNQSSSSNANSEHDKSTIPRDDALGGGATKGVGPGGGSWLLMEWIEGPAIRLVLEQWEQWMKVVESPLVPSISSPDVQHQDGEREWMTSDKREVVILAEEQKVKDLLRRIGQAVGKMHCAGVIHGDLTTSNIILASSASPSAMPSPQSDRDVMKNVAAAIDGLSTTSPKVSPSMDGEIVLIDFGLAYQAIHEEDRAVDLYVLEKAVGSTHPRTEGFFDELIQGYKSAFKDWKPVMKRLEDVRMRGRKRSMVG